jgi:nucleoid DNA-binding protein
MLENPGFSCMFLGFSSMRFARNLGGRPQREGGAGGFAEDSDLRTRRNSTMAKKAAPKAGDAKAAGSGSARAKAATKGEVYTALAEKTGLSKKEVASVFDGLNELIIRELGKKGPGLFQIPGLLKLKRISKPATKAKQGINPFTKEPMMIKAKPARNVIKALPLKALKDSV